MSSIAHKVQLLGDVRINQMPAGTLCDRNQITIAVKAPNWRTFAALLIEFDPAKSIRVDTVGLLT
jgi:hypothetical protein